MVEQSPMRLDRALVERRLVTSRQRAQHAIKQGTVRINGIRAQKSSTLVTANDTLTLDIVEPYVARSAYKLIGALDEFPDVQVYGRVAFDAGASTGGFTQVLLERGARHVIAVDVGHDQLAPQLVAHPAVTNCEGVNLRHFVAADVVPAGMHVDLVVGDLSFISLTLVLPQLVAQLAAQDYVLLVKPQFEVGRGNLSHGIVTDTHAARVAVDNVVECATLQGLDVRKVVPAALTGTYGNQEYVLWAKHKA